MSLPATMQNAVAHMSPSAPPTSEIATRLGHELQHDVRLLRADGLAEAESPGCARKPETSMMFMMPMPPTSSEKPAMPASIKVSVFVMFAHHVQKLRLAADRVVVLARVFRGEGVQRFHRAFDVRLVVRKRVRAEGGDRVSSIRRCAT
jgi:hypothetical protein